MKVSLVPIVVIGLLVAGCSNQVPLVYVPTSQITTQPIPIIGSVTAVDMRGEDDPTWIGAVRGGFGNPLKSLHTPHPLNEMVAQAFREALANRGLLAQARAGEIDLVVTITEFNSTKYIRQEANVGLTVELRDHVTGRQVYRDVVKSALVEGSVLALDNGIFGSVDDLQSIMQKAMNQAVDMALNKPAFSEALRLNSALAS